MATATTTAVSNFVEQQVDGFRACFGGEELKRAHASLAGSAVGGTIKAYLAQDAPPSMARLSILSSATGPGISTSSSDAAAASAALAALQPVTENTDIHARELAHAAHMYQKEEEAAATAAAARQHAGATAAAAAAASGGSPSYDSLYGHGLVLQELAVKAAPGSSEHMGYLRQACDRYSAALQLRPTSHSALYNWGVALSDLARACKEADPRAARECLEAASRKYADALRVQPDNPQALNNWGLVLQELSSDASDPAQRDVLMSAALDKFRHALRLSPDFDRGCYNMGTVCYTYACKLQAELASQYKGAPSLIQGPGDVEAAQARAAREAGVRALFTSAAQYICLAAALQTHKEIYRKSLGVVRQLLPLPFLRAGSLVAPIPSTLGTPHEVWRRDLFVLDHQSLRTATSLEGSLTGASAGLLVTPQLRPSPADAAPLVVPLQRVVSVSRCEDPSLPEGAALWILLAPDAAGDGGASGSSYSERVAAAQDLYLVAEDAQSADAWVDALLLAAHIAHTRSSEALADVLAPAPSGPHAHGHHGHHHGHAHGHHGHDHAHGVAHAGGNGAVSPTSSAASPAAAGGRVTMSPG